MKTCIPGLFVLASFVLSPSFLYAGDPPSDSMIRETAAAELKSDSRLRNADITVDATAGNVTLKGSVGSYFDKLHAEQLCKKITGIRCVFNRLEIGPTTNSDSDIARAVHERWNDDSVLGSHNLKANVSDRIVTIEGEVDSNYQRIRAQRLASEVKGVLIIRNQSEANYGTTATAGGLSPSVNELKAQVTESIDRDAVLSRHRIQVHIDGDAVTLEGVVDNLRQREIATRRARMVPGVHNVNNMIVVGETARQQVPDEKQNSPDSRLVQDIRFELQVDPVVDSSNIIVAATNGIVVLRGTVSSIGEKSRASRAARRIAGVRWVSNELSVDDPSENQEDIQESVARILAFDSAIDSDSIQVSVKDSIVNLSGTVSSIAEKKRAKMLASRIRGVQSVDNAIDVEPLQNVADAVIQQQIVDRLRVDPVTGRITDLLKVTVARGNVLLKGDFADWTEHSRAVHIAESTEGVRSVKTTLTAENSQLVEKTEE